MVYIYSALDTNKRLDYIVQHIFVNILGDDFTIIHDKTDFLKKKGICINYSAESIDKGLQIMPHGLLSQRGIEPITSLDESEWQGFFCFFQQKKGDIPFDIFSASFYLLSLYEEYYSQKLDKHGRFDVKESLAYRKGFLETPLIDRWAYLLKNELIKIYPDARFKGREYCFISTFDIDYPYLYRKKGFIRNAGGAFKDLLQFKFKNIATRIAVNSLLKADPYMKAVLWIDIFHKKVNRPYYLFILTNSKGRYGRATAYPLTYYYNYLKNLQSVTVGLHPSYDTYRDLEMLINEKKKLEKILDSPVNTTRQHFLRMRTPETFQELSIAGFKEDFTVAFSHLPGFRSGTAVPHYFYDIEKEETTGLLLRPTIMMDSTLITHLSMAPQDALKKMKQLIDECKKSGGDYVALWHNSNIAGDKKNNPWINIFIESSRYAISLEKDNFVPENENN